MVGFLRYFGNLPSCYVTFALDKTESTKRFVCQPRGHCFKLRKKKQQLLHLMKWVLEQREQDLQDRCTCYSSSSGRRLCVDAGGQRHMPHSPMSLSQKKAANYSQFSLRRCLGCRLFFFPLPLAADKTAPSVGRSITVDREKLAAGEE